MQWGGERESANLEDRRGGGIGVGGIAGGGIGAIVLVVVGLFLGVDPRVLLDMAGGGSGAPYVQEPDRRDTGSAPDEPAKRFVSVVLAQTEDTWQAIFSRMGRTYQEPRLVLYSGATQSACGLGQSAMGPFYCPGDQRVYLDLAFFQDMQTKLGAPGDFAQAYVIAHEVGHHVQNLLGITTKIHEMQGRRPPAEANALSVRLELQADCFAGVWANRLQRERKVIEPGDIEEGLGAASAVGDDRLQQRAGRHVVPESFTHGSSAQRVRWFKQGLESGDPNKCNTFGAERL